MTDATDIRSPRDRLAHLRSLPAGWKDGEGEPISPGACDTAETLLQRAPWLGRVTGLFPTIEGGLQFENDTFEVAIRPNGDVRVTDERREEEHDKIFGTPLALDEIWRVVSTIAPLVEEFEAASLPDATRRDLLCEFTELRGMAADPATCAPGAVLFLYDCEPILARARVGERPALMMRVPEKEAGADYLVAVPRPDKMAALEANEAFLRSTLQDPETLLYLSDGWADTVEARPMSGRLHEYLLPSPGLFLGEYFEEETEQEALS